MRTLESQVVRITPGVRPHGVWWVLSLPVASAMEQLVGREALGTPWAPALQAREDSHLPLPVHWHSQHTETACLAPSGGGAGSPAAGTAAPGTMSPAGLVGPGTRGAAGPGLPGSQRSSAGLCAAGSGQLFCRELGAGQSPSSNTAIKWPFPLPRRLEPCSQPSFYL